MKFWPSDSFEIDTPLSPEDIVAKIGSRIVPHGYFRWSSNNSEFKGVITRDGFKIRRIIHGRNCFLPVVTGRFIPGVSGTKVVVKMRLDRFATAMMVIVYGGVGLPIIYYTAVLLSVLDMQVKEMVVSVGAIILIWAVFSGSFWFEAKKQKSMLLKMFQDAIITESNIR